MVVVSGNTGSTLLIGSKVIRDRASVPSYFPLTTQDSSMIKFRIENSHTDHREQKDHIIRP